MTDNPYVSRLARYRLEHDLSYQQLAAEMRDAGCPVHARSLHWALTGRLQRQPLDRTLFKIQRFVEQLEDTRGRRGRRREARPA